MARRKQKPTAAAARVARTRRKLARSGGKRVEVTIPAEDAALVRELAAMLRAGGDQARVARERLRPMVRRGEAATGSDLVAFFRASPLVGLDLEIERDTSSGRPVEL